MSDGPVLALDTSGGTCAACVLDPATGRVPSRLVEAMARGHAERLLPMIEEALAEAGLGFRDLSRVAVGIGPGSFTGVRVGVAAARGLSLALAIPALGVSTLEALAFPHVGAVPVLALQDGRRGEFFAALFGTDGAPLAAPAAVRPERLAGFLGAAHGRLRATGSGAGQALEALGAGRVEIVGEDGVPEIADLARIAAARPLPAGGGRPSPLYLRAADARAQSGFAVERA